jgi:HlyD family type I secretion membrane fusion protein
MSAVAAVPHFPARRIGLLAIALAVLAFGFWAWLAPLHGAVVTVGLVKTATNRKFVQHTDGGIVKQVLVRNGDTVKQGQVLIELSDVRVDANQHLLQELAVLESIKLDRLDAEQQLAPAFVLKAERRRAGDPSVIDKAYQRELKIFSTRRGLLDEQVANFQRQQIVIADEQKALRRQIEASRQASRLARDELRINTALENDKFVSKARLISIERTVSEYEAKLSEHEALLAQADQRSNDLALRMASIRSDYQRVAAEEYKEASGRVVQLREQLRPADDAARRKSVLAPVAGKVVGLRVNAPGEVAPAREPLMEIVPEADELLVEAQIGVDSIKHLRTGQTTELRFTTFNSRTTPMVDGELSYIAADAMVDKNGVPSFVIQVRPHASSLAKAGIPALKPGMAAEVYVLLESRGVLDYLLTPITDVLRRTMREP